MKNIKLFESFDINEAKTLFGDTVAERLNPLKNWAEEKGWKIEKSRGSRGDIPAEVRELWSSVNAEPEKGMYKIDTLRIWGKLGDQGGFNNLSDIIKAASAVAIGKEKGWSTSGIKMIEGGLVKKSENRAQTFFNDALGAITINAKLMRMTRSSDPNEFIIFVWALKDEKETTYKLDKGIQAKIDNAIEGLTKEQKKSVVLYLKDRFMDYTD